MPERIRSVGFAFLGLTAAAGLALVVLFAEMGFPLLSPVPLPDSPEPGSVSRAVPLEQGSETGGIAAVDGSTVGPSPSDRQGNSGAETDGKGGTRVDKSADQVAEPVPGDAPAGSDPVVTAPPPASPAPVPTTTTETPSTPAESSPESVESSGSSPDTEAKPGKSTAAAASKAEKGGEKAARPEAKPAKTKPAKPTQTSSAAPAKASKSEAAPTPEASNAHAPASVPLEAGKDKEAEDKKSK